MRALLFTPDRNTPGKSDTTGAFHLEAVKLAQHFGLDPKRIVRVKIGETPPAAKRTQVLDALRSGPPADFVGIFCHGWRSGIQVGFQVAHAAELAAAIVQGDGSTVHESPAVALYCCSTGAGARGGDGGFADALRDAMCRAGATHCRVDAHDRKGHTTQNPYVLRYEGQGSMVGGCGGSWIVSPKAAREFRKWNKALKTTDLRFRFPLMSVAEIHAELFA